MKKIITLLLLCLSCMPNSYSQDPGFIRWRDYTARSPIDTCIISITYDFEQAQDTTTSRRIHEPMVLEIGTHTNRYYSALADQKDSIYYEYYKANPHSEGIANGGVGWRGDSVSCLYRETYTNFKENERREVSRFIRYDYEYTEEVEELEWEFLGFDGEVLGYKCTKVETEFRGRKWIVWFAMDIPLNYGPWKLGGLPGLILKAEDSEGLFSWTAIGIEQPKDKKIYAYKNIAGKHEIRKATRKDIAKLWQRYWLNNLSLEALFNPKVKYATRDRITGKLTYQEIDMGLPDRYYPRLETDL